MYDRPQVQLFGGEQRETLPQIKTHLVSKNTDGTGAGAVGFLNAVFQNKIKKIKVLLHGSNGKM
jgi:hypothetical protein